jgi:hypothetical protein
LPLLDLAGSVVLAERNKGRIQPMAINDDFRPDRSPLFLSEQADDVEQRDIGKALNQATVSSRVLKTSVSALTATAIAIAVLSMADPVELIGNVTALWADKSAVQSTTDPSTPTMQSVASTQDLPPASDAPAREQIVASADPADQSQPQPGQSQPDAGQSQAETSQPVTEELFKQFQAWAAEEEARPKAEPVRPAQIAPVQAAQDAPAQVQSTKRHRRARSVQNARAEIRPHRTHRARVREEQSAPVPIAPGPDPRAQEQALQNSQPPGFLQSLGFRN